MPSCCNVVHLFDLLLALPMYGPLSPAGKPSHDGIASADDGARNPGRASAPGGMAPGRFATGAEEAGAKGAADGAATVRGASFTSVRTGGMVVPFRGRELGAGVETCFYVTACIAQVN